MSEQNQSQPFYRSLPFIVIVSILLPPVGLVLLWLRRDWHENMKLIFSALIIALGLGYFSLYYFVFNKRYSNEAHYTELDKHREQQRQQFGDQAANPNQQTAPNANSQPQPAQQQGNTQQPNTQTIDTAHASRDYWTDFRGPNRDGNYRELAIKTNWAGLTPMWKQPIGGGYASFVAGEGRAYTIEQRRGQEVVSAYDVQTGRELWTQGWNANFQESLGGDGPRATPTYNEGRVYALGATGEFRCLDAKTGKTIWGKNILSDAGASNIQWGMSAAPLIVDDKVIVHPGGNNSSFIAYNKNTGAVVWKSLSDTASYTSPMLVTLGGRKQILAVTASRAVGLAPENGSLLWEYPWSNSASINVSQPIVVDANRVFISAGYAKGAALFEVSGNRTKTIWENNNMKNKFQSSVLLNGYVYGLDEGILTCLDVNTGERKWKGGRYGYGQLVLASDHLIVITEEGNLVLVKATPEKHQEITQIQALQGRSWNVPAIANGKLLIRNTTEMACYNLTQ
jgi:outer membrane protein assembly factor BamB